MMLESLSNIQDLEKISEKIWPTKNQYFETLLASEVALHPLPSEAPGDGPERSTQYRHRGQSCAILAISTQELHQQLQ